MATTIDPTHSHTPKKPKVICIDSGRLRFAEKQAASARGATRRQDWTGWRNHALALAAQSCSLCYGFGHRAARKDTNAVCYCVFRTIFRACHARFHQCLDGGGAIGKVDWTRFIGQGRNNGGGAHWSLRNEEFLADFQLVAFRALNGGRTKEQLAQEGCPPSRRWQLFVLHLLLGAQWRICCRRFGMERGEFFHEIYRIEAILGLAFADTEPHALFPIDEYFSPLTKKRPEPEPKPEPKRRYCA
jgi:hypothetical protein